MTLPELVRAVSAIAREMTPACDALVLPGVQRLDVYGHDDGKRRKFYRELVITDELPAQLPDIMRQFARDIDTALRMEALGSVQAKHLHRLLKGPHLICDDDGLALERHGEVRLRAFYRLVDGLAEQCVCHQPSDQHLSCEHEFRQTAYQWGAVIVSCSRCHYAHQFKVPTQEQP